MLIRIADRKRRLLPKVDDALKRIRIDEYGYCREIDELIGLQRPLIRPTAGYSIDAKIINEFKKKHYKQ